MKVVDIDKIKGGEILARPILTGDYQILLAAGTEIKPEYVVKFKELNVREVYIREETDALLEENIILKEEVKNSCLTKIKKIIGEHVYSNNVELEKISEMAEDVIQDILSNEQVAEKVLEIKERKPDIYEHSLNVCSLATLVAIKLNMDMSVVHDIGVGSILHDLGLRYITIKFTNIDINTLSDKNQEEYKKHTIYGYTTMADENWLSERAKKMILFHHEKKNGTGYPLKTKDIARDCQVVGICEAFDELICGIGCKRVKVHEAIEYLKAIKGIEYETDIVETLLQFTAVYPTGTTVKLSDGSIGIVLRQSEHFPERPILRMVSDKSGKSYEKEYIVDLVSVHNIVIEKVIK